MSQDPAFYLLLDQDFDAYRKSINVRADRIGAKVRTVKIGTQEVRVLSHDDASAQDAAIAYIEAQKEAKDGSQLEMLP